MKRIMIMSRSLYNYCVVLECCIMIFPPLPTACDHVSLCTVASSLPVMVDVTPPLAGSVTAAPPRGPGAGGRVAAGAGTGAGDVLVQYGGFEDPESGVRGYQVAVGRHAHSHEVLAFSPVTGFLTLLPRGLMADGGEYYVHVRVNVI